MSSNLDGIIINIFLSGDVMTGRGIDQVLPHPSEPRIHEPYVGDARGYVELAERVNGPIPQPADFDYIWGDAGEILRRMTPDLRIINLETSITTSDDYWMGKGINYRMHPGNVPCLSAAGIDVCTLANNHILDWGYAGLEETLRTLKGARIKYVGAGMNPGQAEAAEVIEIDGKGRVIVLSLGSLTSGIPRGWAASAGSSGVNLLTDLSDRTLQSIQAQIGRLKRPGDVVVVSIHWGANWGYPVEREESEFARKLIDQAGVDVVHGHSSHHVKGIEVHNGKPIIYGCGDLINDYEGIHGHEQFRGDLSLLYFMGIDPATGKLAGLQMEPMQMKRFRLNRASTGDALWLQEMLNREGARFGTRVEMGQGTSLHLRW